jgi:hypothetical protein
MLKHENCNIFLFTNLPAALDLQGEVIQANQAGTVWSLSGSYDSDHWKSYHLKISDRNTCNLEVFLFPSNAFLETLQHQNEYSNWNYGTTIILFLTSEDRESNSKMTSRIVELNLKPPVWVCLIRTGFNFVKTSSIYREHDSSVSVEQDNSRFKNYDPVWTILKQPKIKRWRPTLNTVVAYAVASYNQTHPPSFKHCTLGKDFLFQRRAHAEKLECDGSYLLVEELSRELNFSVHYRSSFSLRQNYKDAVYMPVMYLRNEWTHWLSLKAKYNPQYILQSVSKQRPFYCATRNRTRFDYLVPQVIFSPMDSYTWAFFGLTFSLVSLLRVKKLKFGDRIFTVVYVIFRQGLSTPGLPSMIHMVLIFVMIVLGGGYESILSGKAIVPPSPYIMNDFLELFRNNYTLYTNDARFDYDDEKRNSRSIQSIWIMTTHLTELLYKYRRSFNGTPAMAALRSINRFHPNGRNRFFDFFYWDFASLQRLDELPRISSILTSQAVIVLYCIV